MLLAMLLLTLPELIVLLLLPCVLGDLPLL
jgi:hypothetical protein